MTGRGLRLPSVLAVAALLLAACGGDAADDATDLSTDEPVVADDSDYQPTVAMDDITDRQVHPIDEVVVSDDGLTLGVRYRAAAEPCSGAVATAVEDVGSVTVTLETGLNPNAAAMTCIAQVIGYELEVTLAEPLGSREIVTVGATDQGSSDDGTATDQGATRDAAPDEGPERGTLSSPDAFVGLGLDEAKRLADREGRRWRIGREDGEQFALTADYDPDRVTFDVDAGVVTLAVAG